MRRSSALAVLVALAASPAAAWAAGSTSASSTAGSVATATTSLALPPSENVPPAGYRLSGAKAAAIAGRVPKIRDAVHAHKGSHPISYENGPGVWQVSFFDPKGVEFAQVQVADPSGRVLQAWTGFQVAWTMARGYPGAFGRKSNALYIWIPLSLFFLAPFLDWRRPLRMLHLDLLMLSFFSVSLAFFNHADIYQSVPLAYPPLLYLLARMLWIGLRRGRDALPPLRLAFPASWLGIAIVFLIGFRVGLNITDSNVIDVGYAGVIGAQHIVKGEALYGNFPSDNVHGDTYGPFNYEAYVPFEQLLGFSGRWDGLPAAHGAAIAFDLLCVLLLYLIGRRIRGPTLGALLAYAWVAYPFTLFTANSNSNDALVGALILATLLLASSRPARGALTALAGLTKFAPFALAPLFALDGLRDEPERRRRVLKIAVFGIAFVAAGALALWPVFAHNDLSLFWNRTVVSQADRVSPFSVWGLYGGLGGLQTAVQVAAVLLALVVAVVPRRKDTAGLAALAAAIIIAEQLGVTHWFYLYIPWFLGPVLIALLGRFQEPQDEGLPITTQTEQTPVAA